MRSDADAESLKTILFPPVHLIPQNGRTGRGANHFSPSSEGGWVSSTRYLAEDDVCGSAGDLHRARAVTDPAPFFIRRWGARK
jgi:hypothetical protein